MTFTFESKVFWPHVDTPFIGQLAAACDLRNTCNGKIETRRATNACPYLSAQRTQTYLFPYWEENLVRLKQLRCKYHHASYE